MCNSCWFGLPTPGWWAMRKDSGPPLRNWSRQVGLSKGFSSDYGGSHKQPN
jgi:hypothetical protein